MRLLAVILIALVGLIQYPLWWGKGGWFRVWALQGQVAEQREVNEGLRARNAALAAEVQDLQTGTGALEERARADLGMIREGEVFVQILPPDTKPPAGAHGVTAPGVAPASTKPPTNAAGNRGATSSSAAGRTVSPPATTPARTPATQRQSAPSATPASVPSAHPQAVRSTSPSAGQPARPASQSASQPASAPASRPASQPSSTPVR